eukprot:TRINITY_DN2717_c1_g6_i1.p2 TRINITY_DN2717_c1_g6~~TRINITY_DN2717_c1_g6_i1.p2  ORF type:complete len:134 (+),score=61.53 TRINITY_DN2717_c1_g6_i1:75-476(+)
MAYSKKASLKARTGIFSAEERKRYEEIAAGVKASKGGDAAKSLGRIEAALTTSSAFDEQKQETFDEKAADFVGIMLDGCGGNTLSTGELNIDTADVKVEEPMTIVEEEEIEVQGGLRDLWGDGDKNPNEDDEE